MNTIEKNSILDQISLKMEAFKGVDMNVYLELNHLKLQIESGLFDVKVWAD